MKQLRIPPLVRAFARRAHALRSEEGAFLIETMVAAVLVAVIAVAMLSAFDGANQASGKTKMRAISGSLAQTDQERMRSMPISVLNKLSQTQSKSVNGVTYKVDSRAEWIADDSRAADCTTNGEAGDYLKITSTVTATSAPTLRPVVVESIVTPAPGTLSINQGSLLVAVVNRAGVGVPNLTVVMAGPANVSKVTDAQGCAFFGYQPVGNYTVTTARSGWVDTMGRPTATKAGTIASQQISTLELQYDQAGSAKVRFATTATDWTSASTTATRTVQLPDTSAKAKSIRLLHSGMETPGLRDGPVVFGSAPWGGGTAATEIVADKLFPFSSPYGVYAGNCGSSSDPSDPTRQTTPQAIDTVQVDPGGTPVATVWMPALNIHATNAAHIKIKATSPSCTGTWNFYAADLTSAGNLKFPGLPYGSYSICADDDKGSNGSRQYNTTAINQFRAGLAPVNLPVPTSGGKGATCGTT